MVGFRWLFKGSGSHAEVYAVHKLLLAIPDAGIIDILIYGNSTSGMSKPVKELPFKTCPHCKYILEIFKIFQITCKWRFKMKYLSLDEVISVGTEFIGDVCYSGEYGQQVYTKDVEEGGIPLEGILYERYSNGLLNYYSFYSNGIANGQRVRFFESGKVKSHCIMDTGTIDGEYIEWYENGNIKLKKDCKYGLVLKMQEFDESGNLLKEKKQLSDDEKCIFEKRVACYEGRTNHTED